MEPFVERQRFNQWWLWLILLATTIVPIVLAILRKTSLGISVLIIIPILLLFIFTTLRTKIDEAGFSFKFFPFTMSTHSVSWEKIKTISVKKYQPLRDFGGWGLRTSESNGTAYTVKGKYGIQIELLNGKKVLIGTQAPHAASEALIFFKNKAANS